MHCIPYKPWASALRLIGVLTISRNAQASGCMFWLCVDIPNQTPVARQADQNFTVRPPMIASAATLLVTEVPASAPMPGRLNAPEIEFSKA